MLKELKITHVQGRPVLPLASPESVRKDVLRTWRHEFILSLNKIPPRKCGLPLSCTWSWMGTAFHEFLLDFERKLLLYVYQDVSNVQSRASDTMFTLKYWCFMFKWPSSALKGHFLNLDRMTWKYQTQHLLRNEKKRPYSLLMSSSKPCFESIRVSLKGSHQ